MPARDPRGADRFDATGAAGPLPSLTHEPFFAALANLEGSEDSAEWRATVAGLVTLRLVDRRVAQAGASLDRSEPDLVPEVVEAARQAVDVVDERDLVAAPLRALVGAVTRPDPLEVARALLSYARALEDDSRWSLSADAYATIVSLAGTPGMITEMPLQAIVPLAFDRLGYSLRKMADVNGARSAYAAARATARTLGDYAAELRIRISEANIFMQAGDLPAAADALDIIIHDAGVGHARLTSPQSTMLAATLSLVDPSMVAEDVTALARHDRGVVASRQQDSALALEHYFAAWRGYHDPVRRERVWLDLAKLLSDMGLRDAARDAYKALYATARQRELRLIAVANLLELAVLEDHPDEFDTFRRVLDDAAAAGTLSASLAASVALYEGQGERRFGQFTAAAAAFERALILAVRVEDNDVASRARQALATLTAGDPVDRTPEPATAPISPTIERITRAVRRVRRRAEVLGPR